MAYQGKVIILGDPAVGKTSLLSRYINGVFKNDYIQTLGANFLIKEIDLKKKIEKLTGEQTKIQDIKEKGFKLYFWDIGGQEDKLFVNEYYFAYSHGAMVVFNLVSRESFDNIEFWISKIYELSGDIPFLLVGNKNDLSDERVITQREIEEKAKEYGVKYYETSAKLDENVDKAFTALSIEILNKLT